MKFNKISIRDLRIRTKLAFTFLGVGLLLTILLSSASIMPLGKINDTLTADIASNNNVVNPTTKINTSELSKTTFVIIFILLVVSGLGIILFKIIDHKYKQILILKQKEIGEQIIKDIKIDHQLVASRAVIMGEEKERGRISRDLHDGLGGKLSGIKILLSNLSNIGELRDETKEKLEQAINQLNSSISELRMIAHNLMPEALVNFGLKDALNDLCTNLRGNKDTKVSFLFYGDPYRFDNSIETSFFRIAQEGVNNALKYAGATAITVQLIQDETWVNLTIQDNGKGFDIKKIMNDQKGGLQNIRSRAESFNGRFHVDSREGIGTELIVEFIYNIE